MTRLERMQARLAQSDEVMKRAGVRLFEGGLAAQYGMRSSVWRCLFCRHSDACRDWLALDRTEIPPFCPNRPIYEMHVKAN